MGCKCSKENVEYQHLTIEPACFDKCTAASDVNEFIESIQHLDLQYLTHNISFLPLTVLKRQGGLSEYKNVCSDLVSFKQWSLSQFTSKKNILFIDWYSPLDEDPSVDTFRIISKLLRDNSVEVDGKIQYIWSPYSCLPHRVEHKDLIKMVLLVAHLSSMFLFPPNELHDSIEEGVRVSSLLADLNEQSVLAPSQIVTLTALLRRVPCYYSQVRNGNVLTFDRVVGLSEYCQLVENARKRHRRWSQVFGNPPEVHRKTWSSNVVANHSDRAVLASPCLPRLLRALQKDLASLVENKGSVLTETTAPLPAGEAHRTRCYVQQVAVVAMCVPPAMGPSFLAWEYVGGMGPWQPPTPHRGVPLTSSPVLDQATEEEEDTEIRAVVLGALLFLVAFHDGLLSPIVRCCERSFPSGPESSLTQQSRPPLAPEAFEEREVPGSGSGSKSSSPPANYCASKVLSCTQATDPQPCSLASIHHQLLHQWHSGGLSSLSHETVPLRKLQQLTAHSGLVLPPHDFANLFSSVWIGPDKTLDAHSTELNETIFKSRDDSPEILRNNFHGACMLFLSELSYYIDELYMCSAWTPYLVVEEEVQEGKRTKV